MNILSLASSGHVESAGVLADKFYLGIRAFAVAAHVGPVDVLPVQIVYG